MKMDISKTQPTKQRMSADGRSKGPRIPNCWLLILGKVGKKQTSNERIISRGKRDPGVSPASVLRS